MAAAESADVIAAEGLRDEGGLVAIAGHPQAAALLAAACGGLVHRGGEAAGLAVADGNALRQLRGEGAPSDVFGATDLRVVGGRWGIAHVAAIEPVSPEAARWAIGRASAEQPVLGRARGGRLAVALCGRLTNGAQLRQKLLDDGLFLESDSDAATVLGLLARSPRDKGVHRVLDALGQIEGGFAMAVLWEDRLVAVRDPVGLRPLLLGEIDHDDGRATIFASDDGAMRAIGARPVREVEAGEMLVCDGSAPRSVRPFLRRPRAACAEELIALAREDVHAFGLPVHPVRVGLGQRLAQERAVDRAAAVIALPGAASIAQGFARQAKLSVVTGLLEGPGGLVGVPAAVEGLNVVLIAAVLGTGDAIRRGVAALRESGAAEIHVRVASPALRQSCPYGVSLPTPEELLAHRYEAAAQAAAVGAETLAALSSEGLHAVLGRKADGGHLFCDACLGGPKPIVSEAVAAEQLGLFAREP